MVITSRTKWSLQAEQNKNYKLTYNMQTYADRISKDIKDREENIGGSINLHKIFQNHELLS